MFDTLGVNPLFIEKLKTRSIAKPTAIQNLVIPHLLADKNIIFRSATGTGKTFAYLLPVLQRLVVDKEESRQQSPAALICAPTFELCSQIKAEADFLSASAASAAPTALLTGSGKPVRQAEDLKKKPVLAVGNPARLLALAKMGKLKFGGLRFLILDDADRLTANECIEETKDMLALIERDKRRSDKNLCLAACSATVSAKTRALLGPLFENAEIIESDDHEILRERIEHWALFSEKRRQIQTLRSLLAAIKTKKPHFKSLVFTSRSDEAGKILSKLQYHHIAAAGLFGKINKKPVNTGERKEALDSFRQGKIDVLVSTDLAARGLDIPNLSHIITLDVPEDKEVYIHRCGRTGRAGKRGIMITIGDETQLRLLASLEKKLRITIKPKELYYGRICDPADIS